MNFPMGFRLGRLRGLGPLVVPPLLALSTGILDLLPGAILALSSPLFSTFMWLLLVYPPLLSLRGTIGGVYSGRLTTSLHLGNMLPRILGNTDEYYTLLLAVSLLHLIGAVIVTLSSTALLILLFGYGINIISEVFLLVFSTFFLTQVVMIPLVTIIAKASYVRGWDPDIVTYPFTSSLGDVAITIFFIFSSLIILNIGVGWLALILSLLNFVMPIIFYSLGFDPEIFRVEVRESLLAIVITSVIVMITGLGLRGMAEYLEKNPVLYFIYPSILTSIGDGGSIIGSTSTTKLALTGELDIETLLKLNLPIIAGLIAFLFTLYGLLGFILFSIPLDIGFLFKLMIAGVFSVSIIGVISIYIAYLTYRRGLDPDHFVTPIESSLADNVTTGVLYLLFIII